MTKTDATVAKTSTDHERAKLDRRARFRKFFNKFLYWTSWGIIWGALGSLIFFNQGIEGRAADGVLVVVGVNMLNLHYLRERTDLLTRIRQHIDLFSEVMHRSRELYKILSQLKLDKLVTCGCPKCVKKQQDQAHIEENAPPKNVSIH